MTAPSNDEWRFTAVRPRLDAKVRLAGVAEEQWGRVRFDQFRALGIPEATIREWWRTGYLYRKLPRLTEAPAAVARDLLVHLAGKL